MKIPACILLAVLLGGCASNAPAPSDEEAVVTEGGNAAGDIVRDKAGRQQQRVAGKVEERVDQASDEAVDSVVNKVLDKLFH